MTDPVLWNCQLSGHQELTVGSVFRLRCEGNIDVSLKREQLKIELPEGLPPYSIHLLNVSSIDSKSLDFSVTSYKAGEFKAPYIRVTDGESKIESGELSWAVQSVLTEESQMNPPLGPFVLSFPSSMIVALVFLGALVLSLIAGFIYHRKQKQTLESELENHKSHLNPIRHFEFTLRGLRRSLSWGKSLSDEQKEDLIFELERALRVYFLREFQVRTLQMSRKQLVRFILKKGKVKDRRAWVTYLKELESSRKKSAKLDGPSILQLLETGSALILRFENTEKYKKGNA